MMAQKTIQGEYYFRRTEMVAGFNFSADSKFEFFYSYGAVDRTASGTFSVEGDTLKLKSNKEAGKDFTVTTQSKQGTGYSIKFEHANQYLLHHILCVFFIGDKKEEVYTDNNGGVKVDFPHCDKIFVQHSLFPDIFTLIKGEENDNNNFTLSLNPSLEQVSFKGVDFQIVDGKTITCLPNYFMPMDGIAFIKN